MPARAGRFASLCLSSIAITQVQAQDVQLEEIVVTAQKRAESLQDVPISVSVVGGAKIAEANIQNLQEMTPYVPNFYQVKTPTSNEIYIRGIGSSSNAGFEQSVGMFYDDIYMSRARQTLTPFFDLQRVEVLRGPQPILFGKNTSAGAISIISAQPTENFEATISALAGTQEERKLAGSVSGPLGNNLRGRVAFIGQHIGGWVKNEFNDEYEPKNDDYALRGILAFDAGDWLDGFFKVERSRSKQEGAPYEITKNTQIPDTGATLPSPNGWIPPQLTGVEAGINYRGNFGNTPPFEGPTVDFDGTLDNVALHLNFLLGEHTLTSITGYSAYEFTGISDLDQSPANLIGADQTENYNQWSQELRVTSPLGRFFEYIGGIYLQRAELDIATDVSFGFTTLTPASPTSANGQRNQSFDQKSDLASAFFQGTFNFTDSVRLRAGLRYTYEKKELDKVMALSSFELGPLIPGTPAGDLLIDNVWLPQADSYPYVVSPSRTESDWQPQLGLEWNVIDEVLLYGTASKGFKGGGYDSIHSNGQRLDELEFDPETAYSYEIGTKTTFWDNRATVNFALFMTQFEDLQVSIYNGTSGFNVSNAAKATSQGAEIESRFLLTPNFVLMANGGYLNYEYDEYDGAPCTTAQLAQRIVDNLPTAGCINDLSGETVNYAPRWSGSFSGTYTWNMTNALDMLFTLDALYRSKYYLESDLDENAVQEAFWLFNGRIALRAVNGHWDLALIGKNLSDEKTASVGGDVPFGNGTVYGLPDFEGSYYKVINRPRSAALEFTYRFF